MSESPPEPTPDETEQDDVDDAGDQPAIEGDEMADMSAVAGDVENEVAPGQDESADEDLDDLDDVEMDPDRTSIGDVYCNILGMSGAIAKDELGSGLEDNRKDVLDEYAEIARDLDIDDAVDDLLEEHGGPDSLSPGQTVVIMSVVWFGMVCFEDPEILEGLANGGPA